MHPRVALQTLGRDVVQLPAGEAYVAEHQGLAEVAGVP
jgi:hypothetical protein